MVGDFWPEWPPATPLDQLRLELFLDLRTAARAEGRGLLGLALRPLDHLPQKLEPLAAVRAANLEDALVALGIGALDQRDVFLGRRRAPDDLAVCVGQGAFFRDDDRVALDGDLHRVDLVAVEHAEVMTSKPPRGAGREDLSEAPVRKLLRVSVFRPVGARG